MPNIYYKRVVCFCNKKINKVFKCDWFQVIPLENYIDSEVKNKHYPFILEYKVDKKDIVHLSFADVPEMDSKELQEQFSELSYEFNTVKYLLRLLSTISNFYFFRYDISDQAWFLSLKGEKEEDFSCRYGVKHYVDSNLKGKMDITKFTKTEYPEIDLVEHSEYYTHPDIDNEENNELSFGQHTELFFSSILKLDKTQKQFFDSAITLIYNGQQIRNSMRSLAFLSFISSIETMTTLEGKLNKQEIDFECKSCNSIKSSKYHCHDCERPIWGISQSIKLYLEKYLTKDPLFKTVINKLYSRRSKIAHAGSLLSGDLYFEWENPKLREQHNDLLIESMQYSKMSIVNYVLTNGVDKNN
jgi:hypothetical protein